MHTLTHPGNRRRERAAQGPEDASEAADSALWTVLAAEQAEEARGVGTGVECG